MESHAIKYGNDEIFIFCYKGLKYIDVKKICDNIGITWPNQLKKIKESPKFLRGWQELTNEGNNKVLCLDKKTFFTWLWGIEADRVKQSVQSKVVDYQENLDKVIDKYLDGISKKEVEEEINSRKENLEAIQEKIAVSKKKIELVQQLNSLSPFSNDELFQIRNKILASILPGIKTELQQVSHKTHKENFPQQQQQYFNKTLPGSQTESNIGYL